MFAAMYVADNEGFLPKTDPETFEDNAVLTDDVVGDPETNVNSDLNTASLAGIFSMCGSRFCTIIVLLPCIIIVSDLSINSACEHLPPDLFDILCKK